MRSLILVMLLAPSLLAAGVQIPILAYHQVEPVPQLGWSVSTEDFEDQMQYLSAAGYHVVPLADAYELIAGKRDSLPSNPIVITVDDGFVDSYTTVFPILKRFGYPWSIFIYPNFLRNGAKALRWPQVVELANAGVDVESNTVSHPHLLRKSHADMSDADYAQWLHGELANSKAILEKQTGKPVRFLAYPYGDWDAGVAKEAAQAGYLCGLTSWFGFNQRGTNLFELRRSPMTSDTTIVDFTKAAGALPLEVRDMNPPNGGVASPSTVTAVIQQPAALDPASVHILLLGESGTASFDPATGIATIRPKRSKRAQRHVVIYAERASDHQPVAAAWTFFTSAEAKKRNEANAARLHELPLHHDQSKRQ